MKTLRIFCLGAILIASYSSLQAQALSFSLPFEMHFEELSVTLVIGLNPDGSTKFVDGLDMLAPPPPPDATAFDARIRVNNVDYFTKYKENTLEEKEFTFLYAPASGVTMTWDHESLSDYGNFTVTDALESISINLQDFNGELTPSELSAFVENAKVFIIKVEPKSMTDPMQRSVNLTGIEGYRMLSSPVATDFATLLAPLWTQGAMGSNNPSGDVNIWTLDHVSTIEETNWQPVSDMANTIAPGSGLIVYVFEDDDPLDPDETGGFPKTLTVSGAEHADGVIPDINTQANGWTLLGNPFVTPISFTDLIRENITNVIYIWDVNYNDQGDKSEENDDNDPGAGGYRSYSIDAETGEITDGIIAAFQGFFIQNDKNGNGAVSFPVSAKVSEGEFFGKQTQPSLLRLELKGQGMRNSTWLSFQELGSMEQLTGDAHQLASLSQNYALLAGQKGGALFDISILPIPDKDFKFPLSAVATIGGSYEIAVTDLNLSFEETLYLEDRVTKTAVELTQDMVYEFTLDQVANISVANPFELIQDGPAKAVSSEEPRFVITANKIVDAETPADLPQALELGQNYPNPFNPTTQILYALPEQSYVRLEVYNSIGQRMTSLVNESQSAGRYKIRFDASHLPSGLYLYRLKTEGFVETKTMTLVK